MMVRLNKEQIATLLRDENVQKGIEKASKGIALPGFNTTESVLEFLGAAILTSLENKSNDLL